MRVLSDSTKIAVNKIVEVVTNANISIETLIESVRQVTNVSEAQAEGVVELTKALTQISTLAEKLVMMGKVDPSIDK